MPFEQRVTLIEQIEEARQSTVVTYLTSIRPNFQAQMSEDAVRVMFDQMLALPSKRVKQLDVFLCSNGGSGTVPWRLISLFREYAERVSVLLPYRAYSAATLLALGADEIVMHPFAEMGPIDPTVTNEYNPIDTTTNRKLGISVEDVKAYIAFVKSTVGIHHEDELVKTIEILATKVHPLALGNVERFLAQSRMIAAKILRTHMKEKNLEHRISEIVENLASKLYFHGHPINREEAQQELGLKIATNTPEFVERLMWELYMDYEEEFENRDVFDPMGALFRSVPDPSPPAAGSPPQVSIIPPGTFTRMELLVAAVESARLSSRFKQTLRFIVASAGANAEPLVRTETLAQAWEHTPAVHPEKTGPHSD